MKRELQLSVLAAALLVAAACGSTEDTASPAGGSNLSSASAADPMAAPVADRPDRVPLIKGPVSPAGYRAILGTGDLGVGPNRVGFVLTSRTGFVTDPSVLIVSRYVSDAGVADKAVQTAKAELHRWPYGNRGLYTADLDFDRDGKWAVDISIDVKDGTKATAHLEFDVARATSAPRPGDVASRSVNKTVADVQSLDQITTGSLQDPELYSTTIAQAVTSGSPTVIVMASPAFCTNEVCGPQVDVLQELKNNYRGEAHFIHVDFYDNPDEIQGDLDKARISPVVREWGLPSIEWTFVVDKKGRIAARFEGFATYPEVESALQQVL